MFHFQVCTVACLIGLCASMSLRAPFHMLPILGRLRLMLFVTIFTLLTTSVLLFLDISHTVYLFPFNWPLIVSNRALAFFSTHPSKPFSNSSCRSAQLTFHAFADLMCVQNFPNHSTFAI